MELPADVKTARNYLRRDPSHRLSSIARRLLVDAPEMVKLWRRLERKRRKQFDHEGMWVWSLLEKAAAASELPAFHHYTAKRRKRLASDLSRSAQHLARNLRTSGLDVRLVYDNGFFYPYDDFSERRQREHINAGDKLIAASTVIEMAAERASKKIREEPQPGKIGKHAAQIRFIRIMAAQPNALYGELSSEDIAVLTRALFGPEYPSDKNTVEMVLGRPPRTM